MFTTVIWNTDIGDTRTVAQTAPKNRNLEKHIKLESFAATKKKKKTIRETYRKQHMNISSKQLTPSQVIKTNFSRGTNVLFPVL